MNANYDWLDKQIDTLREGRSLRSGSQLTAYKPDQADIAILRMAAGFSALGSSRSKPDPAFVASLRKQVLEACTGSEN